MRTTAENKIIVQNRQARHDYFILETIEAGLALTGTEVKSLRAGRGNIKDSYVEIRGGEAFLVNCHISPYEYGNRYNHDETRPRKLLLHKGEIMRLLGKVREKGLTLIPLRLYLNRQGRVKVELSLAKGKKLYDKREDAARRDAQRRAERGGED